MKAAMLAAVAAGVAAIEFTVGTPDLRPFAVLLFAALLNAGVRAVLFGKHHHARKAGHAA